METIKRLDSCDGSVKFLFRLADGNTVETLYMYDRERELTFHSTVCVSSQVGCNLGCTFCATGKLGFVRNLGTDEIVAQVDACRSSFRRQEAKAMDAVVFAGMGEPLLNYHNVRNAIFEIRDRMGICNFELVTAGMVPEIYELAEDFCKRDIFIRLNTSLHASHDLMRRQMMPGSAKYAISTVLRAASDYADRTGSIARVRYMLMKGLNDSEEDADRLVDLLRGKPLKLIVSQYNENRIDGLQSSSMEDVDRFYEWLRPYIPCGIFKTFGADIKGGCGQLKGSAAQKSSDAGNSLCCSGRPDDTDVTLIAQSVLLDY